MKLYGLRMRILKKTLRVIFWIVLSLLLIFILIDVLIRIPAIQTKVSDYATSLISGKTHTRVNIQKVGISFPKSVKIEGLFLDDINKDTLLYISKAKVNISFKDLFRHELHIVSFALEEVNLNLNRIGTDSLFNFNFLLTAFADTSLQVKPDSEKKSAWTFSLDHISLINSLLHINDDYGGMYIAATLNSADLKMDKINLTQSKYNINELLIKGLKANVLLNKGDSTEKQSVIAEIKVFRLKDALADLQNQILTSDDLYLSKSDIHLSTIDTGLSNKPPTALTSTPTEKSNWKISVKNIDLDDNSIAYNIDNIPEIKNTFDINHLNYRHLTLDAENFTILQTKPEYQ